MKALLACVCAALALGLGVLPGAAAAVRSRARCARASAGGDWPSYGHDLQNTRDQPAEHVIGASNAASLRTAWTFRTTQHGMSGGFDNTPVESGGCLYDADSDGWVFALNARTGALVWKTRLPYSAVGSATTSPDAITGSPLVDRARGLLFVNVADLGRPYVAALNLRTGAVRWRTVVTHDPGTYILASAVVFEDPRAHAGTVVAGWGGDNTQQHYRGGVAYLDAATGHLLKSVYVVPDAEYAQGYAGGSVWATGAVDPGSRSLFIGTGNPEAQGPQSPYTDALLKFNLDRRSPRFGELEATYEGTPDTGSSQVGQVSQPVCSTVPQGVLPYPVNSVPCAHADFDFGASPNLYRDRYGRLVIADLQKAGVFHAALAASMKPDWQQTVAAGCFACNAASGAFENGEIVSVASLPGHLVALDATTGALAWAEPITDAAHYQSTSVANGVVYVYDGEVLHLFAAASGQPLAAKPLLTGVNGAAQSPTGASGISSSGIAIARHTVYVAGGEEIDALRLGG